MYNLILYVIVFLSLITEAWSFNEVDFYNVGQGHCVVARSPIKEKGIMIIDAGSSSTIGIDGINGLHKFVQLGEIIYSSIKKKLDKRPLRQATF